MKLSTGSGFESETWPEDDIWGSSARTWVADFNGDGLSDIATIKNGTVYVKLSTGTGFTSSQPWLTSAELGDTDHMRVGDFNGDGLADIASESGGKIYMILSTGSGFVEETWPVTNSWGPGMLTFVGDFNGDGRADFLSASDANVYMNLNKLGSVDVLQGMTNGLGSKISVDYAPATDTSESSLPGWPGPALSDSSVYPVEDVHMPFYVVKDYSTDNGVGGMNRTDYGYSGFKYHHLGNASLGFASVTSVDEQSGLWTTTGYLQDYDQGLVGVPSLSETYLVNAGGPCVLQSHTTTWQGTPVWDETPGTRGVIEVEKTSQVDTVDKLSTCQPYKTVTTTYSNYQYGSPGTVAIDYGDGYGQTTSTTYWNDTTDWILAKPTRASVTATAPGKAPMTRTSAFAYDSLGRLTSEVIEPDNPTFTVTTSYTLDTFGNRTSATTSGQGIASRTTSTTYSADGRFPLSLTNALGQTETHTYDPVTGNLSSLTGPNGLTTVWAYDGFGRKVYEGRADGTTTTISFANCASGCNYSERTDTSGAPSTMVDYDLLNRKVRTAKQGFQDGSWIDNDIQYDALGRVARKSMPYYDGGTAQWTSMQYDVLGRPTTVTEPGNRVSTISYDGYTTTTTNPLSQTVVKTKNSQGKVVSVSDAGGIQNYDYDAYGDLLSVTDPLGNVTQMSYDIRGRKVSMTDPDMGHWTYQYDVLGELTQQTDAKGQVTTSAYDPLGRLTSRTIPEGTSTWTYDSGTGAAGKLSSVTGFDGTKQDYTYDLLGRTITITRTIGADELTVSYGYDTAGRVATISYPGGSLQARHVYTATGYLWQVLDGSNSDALLWQADNMDAFDHFTHESYGNGVDTVRTYDPATGLIQTILSQNAGGAVQNLAYQFDAIGNLVQRSDVRQGLSETFTYDSLNRLTGVSGVVSKSYQYDAVGNLTYKSDVGSYTYGGSGAGPHAVTSISGTVNTSFSYDANGNMLSGNGRTLTWASFNKPTQITQGGNAVLLGYDADYKRVRKETASGKILYFGKLSEEHISGTTTAFTHYVYAGNQLVATIQTTPTPNQPLVHFIHTDHLGSIESITDENGNVVEHLSFDAFGKRRNPDWTDATTTITSSTTRGYTGHEMDDSVGLVNMNARLYDPVIGRFLSPDTVIQFTESTQGYNRYTYVNNNPLSFTDPDGHWLLALLEFIKDIGAAVYNWGFAEMGRDWLGANIFGGNMTMGAMMQAGLTTYALSDGNSTAAWQGAFTAGVFNIVGGIPMPQGTRVVVHGIVGGAIAQNTGGQFGAGFMAGSFGEATSLGLRNTANPTEQLVAASILGGIGSQIGGGSFESGALTAAFGYLYNDASHLSSRRLSAAGLKRLMAFEGWSGTIYKDDAGYDTIGYGHRLKAGEEVLYANGISREQGLALLRQDIMTAELAVNRLVEVPLSQGQFDALVSFTYNEGPSAFSGSTLLEDLNAGNYSGAANQFQHWNLIHINGQPVVSDVLTERRAVEQCMFTGGCQ